MASAARVLDDSKVVDLPDLSKNLIQALGFVTWATDECKRAHKNPAMMNQIRQFAEECHAVARRNMIDYLAARPLSIACAFKRPYRVAVWLS
jgi:hypothetical protein